MRSVALTSPEPLIAGSLATWTCGIVLHGASVEAGGCIKVAFDLRGESGYQSFPQGEDAAAANFASVSGPEGVDLALSGYAVQHARHGVEELDERTETESYFWRDLLGIQSSLNLHIARVQVASGGLEAGDRLVVQFGDRTGGSPGMTVPGQANAYWRHWVAVQRQEGGHLELLGGDTLTIRPGPPERLNVVAPSVVSVDEEVEVRHVVLDAHGNPVRAARVFFPPADEEPGGDEQEPFDIIEVSDERVGLSGFSNPIELAEEPELRLFWGDIHGHSVISDGGARTPHEYYQWGRDAALLDFAALTDHDFGIALYDPDKHWEMVLEAARAFNEPGRFVTIPGWEISHAGLTDGQMYGHKNVYFVDDNPPFHSSSPYGKSRARADHTHIEELIARLESEDATFMIVDHTSHMMTDWDRFDRRYERLVEVYSLFGASEALDVPCPVGPLQAGKTARDGLDRGYRLGFTAGTDTHMGAPGSYRETSFGRGHVGGLTAVWAEELTREAIFDALWSRRTYATRGARILLRTDINGWAMGEQFQVLAADEPRHIHIGVAGTAAIETLDLIHNGKTLQTWHPGQEALTVEFEHDEPLKGLPGAPGRAYYYVRVIQEDGGMAWSSPTWVIAPD